MILYINSDNLLRWDRMRLASNGNYVNDATVTWALEDAGGDEVATGSLEYVSATNGQYDGVLESTVVLVSGGIYYLKVTAESGQANGFRRVECVAAYQDED